MSYSTKTEETKKFEESKYLAPGIHEVKITKIEAVEPEGKAPYLNITLENTNGQIAEDKLYMSPAAKTYSEITLGEIKVAVGLQKDKEVEGETLTDFAKNLFKKIGNKTFRHRFIGEEIQGKLSETGEQKKNWFKARIGKRFSSEAINTEPSRLKPLDKTNQYDWKTIPTADTIPTISQNGSDGLLF